MTEYFRIEGTNLIDFDRQMVSATAPIYNLGERRPPRDMSKPMTQQEIVMALPSLPLGVRGHALNRGMSMVTFPFDIQAGSDVAMEQALHDLAQTLNDGQLHIESEDARGTQAVVHYKANNAVQHSYKTIYFGRVGEAGSRDVLGARAKASYLRGLELTLYMEPKWRPETNVALGPNEIYCPGLEEDGNADGLADNWNLVNVPTCTMESAIVLQGFYSQKVVTRNMIGDGIQGDVFVAPAGVTTCIAYAWIARPAAPPSDIIVELYDSTAPAVRGSALYDTGGWDEATAKDGATTFYRVEVAVAAGIVPANNHRLRIRNTQDTSTTFYVDKAYWKWDTITVPDEWCDHPLIYSHYDTTEAPAYEGHQNYFDVCDLKGTDEARLLLRVEYDRTADLTHTADLIVGRRSQWDYPSPATVLVRDIHWLEAENATTLTNWAAAALARCSGGNCISNAANIAGSAQYRFFITPGAGQYGSQYMRGRHDVFGVVYTDDAANTQYRLSYTNMHGQLTFYNKWVKQPLASTWQLIYLGEINFDKFLRSSTVANDLYLTIEYAKDAVDTVSLDCMWLLSKTEPEARLHCAEGDWLGMPHYWAMDRTEDFDYEEKEYTPVATVTVLGELCLQGDVITLTPNMVVGQRLYFSCESVDTAAAPDEREWEGHGVGTDLQMIVNLSYLPQYRSPLD
ncbi:MAG TPA: hypothetical protein VMW79_10940 [Anaerolineae bacterium]|nr:hypothetical protein [Anaerolineae bacterium]